MWERFAGLVEYCAERIEEIERPRALWLADRLHDWVARLDGLWPLPVSQHGAATTLLNLMRDDFIVDEELDADAILDYMGMMGLEFAPGTAASKAWFGRITGK